MGDEARKLDHASPSPRDNVNRKYILNPRSVAYGIIFLVLGLAALISLQFLEFGHSVGLVLYGGIATSLIGIAMLLNSSEERIE